MRNTHTLALIAAAVGVPYTASETEIGRRAIQTVHSRPAVAKKESDPPGDDPISSHREVERILETSVDRFRYPSTPEAIARQAADPRRALDPRSGGIADPLITPNAQAVAMRRPAAGGAAGNPGEGSGDSADAGSPSIERFSTTGKSGSGDWGNSLVGGPVADLREVLRFDISPEWVTQRFTRVTTVLADTALEGLRVPLVTGIGPSDLAGSITYYFDNFGTLQRVMLHGFTGDVSRVVRSMTEHYGLEAEPTLDAGVYTRRWNGIPVHFLRLTRAPVVYSDAVHHKFVVYLELNQPDLRFGISPEAQRIIEADRGTGRW